MDLRKIINAIGERKVQGIRKIDSSCVEILFDNDVILKIGVWKDYEDYSLDLEVQFIKENWITKRKEINND